MRNQIVNVDGTKWLVREAISKADVDYAIAMARCTGSVGGKHIEEYKGVSTVRADVVRLNEDGTECQPS